MFQEGLATFVIFCSNIALKKLPRNLPSTRSTIQFFSSSSSSLVNTRFRPTVFFPPFKCCIKVVRGMQNFLESLLTKVPVSSSPAAVSLSSASIQSFVRCGLYVLIWFILLNLFSKRAKLLIKKMSATGYYDSF